MRNTPPWSQSCAAAQATSSAINSSAGVLAAYTTGSAFCVLVDARRVDLVEAWFHVLQAAGSAELRCRLQLLTWQELAAALPLELPQFLAEKYGIVA